MKGTRPSWSTDSNCLRYLDLGLSPRHTIAAHKELLWVRKAKRLESLGGRSTRAHFLSNSSVRHYRRINLQQRAEMG